MLRVSVIAATASVGSRWCMAVRRPYVRLLKLLAAIITHPSHLLRCHWPAHNALADILAIFCCYYCE